MRKAPRSSGPLGSGSTEQPEISELSRAWRHRAVIAQPISTRLRLRVAFRVKGRIPFGGIIFRKDGFARIEYAAIVVSIV